MTELTIRPATPLDATACVAHMTRHFAESGKDGTMVFSALPTDGSWLDGESPAEFAAKLASLWVRALSETGWARCWLALAGDDVVGALALRGGRDKATLHRAELAMGLELPYRGQGWGRRLLEAALVWAEKQKRLDWIHLSVFAHNEPAVALYRAYRFEEVGRVPDAARIGDRIITDVLMVRHVALGPSSPPPP